MLAIFTAVVSVLDLSGSIAASHTGDYVLVEFEVPAGIAEIQVSHQAVGGANVLDWGLWGPTGFRGWGGGLVDDAVVGASAASRGYLPGTIEAGTWTVVIGKAVIAASPADYQLTVTLRDDETLIGADRASFDPVVLESGARWYRGDLHVHSRQSGDASATLDQIASLARSQQLDFVALSDHNTVAQHSLAAAHQASLDDLLLVRAAEVTTYAGHANAFGLERYVDHRVGLNGNSAADIIDDLTGQGATVSINHPALELGDACIGCAWGHDDTPWDKVSAVEIQTANYDATIGVITPRAIAIWEEQLAAGYHLAAVGGSDDHRAGTGSGANDSPVGAPTTMVYADALSEAAILGGIRAGRTVVLLRGPDSPTVELTVRAGGDAGMIGDTVAGASAVIEAHVVGGAGMDLSLVTNGEPGELVAIDSDDFSYRFSVATSEAGDRHHIEVLDSFLPVTITSHVWVDYAPEDGGGGCCSANDDGPGTLWLLLLLTLAAAANPPRRLGARRSSRG